MNRRDALSVCTPGKTLIAGGVLQLPVDCPALPPAGISALVEIGEAIWARMAAFACVYGGAACFAGAVALIAFKSRGRSGCNKRQNHNQERSDWKRKHQDLGFDFFEI
jgi:hypothetical protein